jgi:hypothetical protein
LAGTFVFSLTACAPKEKTADSTSASASSTTGAMSATTAATVAPTPNVVTVHAKDFSYDAPSTLPAGMTTFHLINDGKVLHHINIIRIDSGKTLADLKHELAMPAAPPAWVAELGGPNAVGPAQEASATLNLVPGSYAIVCFVDQPGGVPHFAKGMIQPFTVIPGPAGATAAAPTADATIELSDYAFSLSTPLTAGKHMIAVKNIGGQAHEVELVRFAPGKTMDNLLSWMAKPAGPPPAEFVGGVSGLRGVENYFPVDLTPGNYGFICFLPDVKDGKPHFMHGMTKTVTVM